MASPRPWAARLLDGAARALPAAVLVHVLLLIALAGLTYCLPIDPPRANAWGGNVKGVLHFRSLLRLEGLPSLPLSLYTRLFGALLVAVWLSYGAVVVGAAGSQRELPRWSLPGLALLVALLAIFIPPALSTDVYAYAALARMPLLYGWNPYLHSPMELRALDDASARFQVWDLPSVYPPVWTLLSEAVLWPLKHGTLWWQVVALKLVEGAAVIGAAMVGSRVAEHYRPGTRNAALLGIALNPLLLVEGPVNGHNDVLMVALMVGALFWHTRGAAARAFFFLGLSAGIKFITLGLLPWLVLEQCRKRSLRAALPVVALGGLALLPLLVGYVPFWSGPETLQAAVGRIMITDRDVPDPAHSAARVARETLADPAAGLGSLAFRYGPLLGVYLALGIWVGRTTGRSPAAWTLFAGLLALLPRWPYPWYYLWPFGTALVRWDRLHALLITLCALIAMVLMMGYGMPATFFARWR